jgi:hypothetical protein
LHGVTLYRETERAFSVGDRVQFTVPNRERNIANRELGTIERSTIAATYNYASTQAGPSHSTSKRIRISTTAMQ